MRIEFLSSHALSPDELEYVRREIEGAANITKVSDELRGIVARNWPHLLCKLPPPEEE